MVLLRSWLFQKPIYHNKKYNRSQMSFPLGNGQHLLFPFLRLQKITNKIAELQSVHFNIYDANPSAEIRKNWKSNQLIILEIINYSSICLLNCNAFAVSQLPSCSCEPVTKTNWSSWRVKGTETSKLRGGRGEGSNDNKWSILIGVIKTHCTVINIALSGDGQQFLLS